MFPSAGMSQSKDIPAISRFITAHDGDGKTVFSDAVSEVTPFKALPDGAEFAVCYATDTFPVDMTDDKDLHTYQQYQQNLPGITISTGTVLRVVDMRPGALAPMHRTVSVDYGVVIEGEVELILDSGEKRLMRRGDISIQRGTNHTWKNTSETSWARMLYVLQAASGCVAGGKALSEDTGAIPGVRAST